MFGTPYQLTTNIPGIIRKQLRHLYPEKEFEVINLGAAAINSNVVLDLTKLIINLDPDLVLIYMGHNEFYGPDGIGASWIQRTFPQTIPLTYALGEIRLVQLFEKFMSSISSNSETTERNLMKQVSQQNKVYLHSDESDRIFNLFQANVTEIVSKLKNHNIPIIISNITSNYTFPPFLYDTSAQLAHFSEEVSLLEEEIHLSKYSSALTRTTKLYKLDSSNAYIDFLTGKIYLESNKLQQAKEYLQQAIDNDLLKFRAPKQINTILEKAAVEQQIPIISSDSLFLAITTSGMPSNDLFFEHLHPNSKGYYEIANLFVKKIVDLHLISSTPISTTKLLPFNYDSLSISWLDLAYGNISIQHLTQRWPFQNYSLRMIGIYNSDTTLNTIAVDVYKSKMSLTEGCYKTALRFIQIGLYQNAITTYACLSEEYPNNYYPYYLSGTLYKEIGDISNAIRQYTLSLQCNPKNVLANIDIGLLEINIGKFEEAITHFNAALSLGETEKTSPLVRATIYYGLSAAFINKGDHANALRYIDQSLKLAPDYEAANILSRKLHTVFQ